MKVYNIFACMALLMVLSLALFWGCEYDVAPPQWDENKDKPLPSSPSISQITPSEAVAGVNTITIEGSGFAGSRAIDHVYFNDIEVDTVNIVSISTTAITVRRPNIVSDSCTVKVNTYSGGTVVKFKPYKITSVISKYGAFNENTVLSAMVVDAAQNVFVVGQINFNRIYKIHSNGFTSQDTTHTPLPRYPSSMVVGPDGRLYLIGNGYTGGNVNILAVDTTVHPYRWSVWRTLPAGRTVRFGDFDANGYFYAGGPRSGLMIIAPDSSNRAHTEYASGTSGDSIYAVRVINGYLYVAARLNNGEKGIWRHTISVGGVLGGRELYLDFNADTTFSRRTIRSIGISSNGTIYIGTDSPNPLLVVDPVTKQIDYFYKNILPPYSKWFQWGNDNFIYMMSGNTNPAQEWTFYKVDMGSAGK